MSQAATEDRLLYKGADWDFGTIQREPPHPRTAAPRLDAAKEPAPVPAAEFDWQGTRLCRAAMARPAPVPR